MIPIDTITRGIPQQGSKPKMATQTTRWSIIIPVYQEKATFRQLLDAVLKVELVGVEKEIIVNRSFA